jgi:hypothetical protein
MVEASRSANTDRNQLKERLTQLYDEVRATLWNLAIGSYDEGEFEFYVLQVLWHQRSFVQGLAELEVINNVREREWSEDWKSDVDPDLIKHIQTPPLTRTAEKMTEAESEAKFVERIVSKSKAANVDSDWVLACLDALVDAARRKSQRG